MAQRKTGPEAKSSLLPLLAAVLAPLPALAAYLGSLRHPFVYDDLTTIVGNESLRDVGNLRAIFWHDAFRPLLNLSYAIDYRVWGESSFGFHLTSLVLHATATFLLALLLRRAIMDASPADMGTGQSALLGGVLAGLWAAHPMLTEAVGYVSGRSEVLCGVLVLASLLALRRAGDGQLSFIFLGLVSFLLALAVKEVAAMVPLIWWLWDRCLQPGSEKARARRFKTFQLPLLLFVGLAGSARLLVLLRVEATAVRPWGEYLAQQSVVAWRYLGLMVLPRGQSIVHDVSAPKLASSLGALVAWATLAYLASRYHRRWPLATLGFAWWLAFLAPSSLVPLAEAMAEHRVYLAAIGPLLVLAELFRLPLRPASRGALGAILLVCIPCLAWASSERMTVWSDPISLWRDAAQKAPTTWAPHYALGDSLQAEGRCAEAIEAYSRAVQILPDQELRAYSNLGICLAKERRLEEAEAVFRKALEFDSGFAPSHNNLGQLALVRKNYVEAIQHFRRTIEVDRDNLVAHLQLAALFERFVGDRSLALGHCREALRIMPSNQVATECVVRLEALDTKSP